MTNIKRSKKDRDQMGNYSKPWDTCHPLNKFTVTQGLNCEQFKIIGKK